MNWKLVSDLPKLHLDEKGFLFESEPVLGLMMDGSLYIVECRRDLGGRVEWRLSYGQHDNMTRVIRQWCELPELPENFERG